MVVICFPAASLTRTPHERIATPSMWTVHAPHCAMPQPYLVPVRPTFSRIAHSSGVSGSTSTSKALPLIVRLAIVSPIKRSFETRHSAPMLDGKVDHFKSTFRISGREYWMALGVYAAVLKGRTADSRTDSGVARHRPE